MELLCAWPCSIWSARLGKMNDEDKHMKNSRLVIAGGRVIDPSQELDQISDVLIESGRIIEIRPVSEQNDTADTVINADGLVVSSGFIDLHCHMREPGYEDKETILTGISAAASGGFTTVCLMPNTNPPVDNLASLNFIFKEAKKNGYRLLPIACVTQGRKGSQLVDMFELADAGAVGFSDDGSPVSDPRIMQSALTYSLGSGLPIINHSEDLTLSAGGVMNEGWVSNRLGLKGIPYIAEDIMVARDIELAEYTGGRLHLAHISTMGALKLVKRAKESGLDVTAEVTPHHLTLTQDIIMGNNSNIDSGGPLPYSAYDTMAKVNPPLRAEEDVQALVAGLKEGYIDAIATDHAPHSSVDKDCPFDEAAFGISGLETALGLGLRLVHDGDIDLSTLIERLTVGPARILGPYGEHIGNLKKDSYADLVIFDPQKEWKVETTNFASLGKNSPLNGYTLKGKVLGTISNGEVLFRDESLKEVI